MKDIYPETKHDVIYVDLKGNVKIHTTVILGDKKHYKRVLSPVFTLEDKDGNLIIANNHQNSLVNSDFETLKIDKTGHVEELYKAPKSFIVKNNRRLYYHKIMDGKVSKVGNYYIFFSTLSEIKYMSNNKQVSNDLGLSYVITDLNLKPIKMDVDYLDNNSFSQLHQRYISEKEGLILYNKSNNFYLGRIKKENDVIYYSLEPLKLATDKLVKRKMVSEFHFYEMPIDMKNRKFYLLKKYYDIGGGGQRQIRKIGVSVINY